MVKKIGLVASIVLWLFFVLSILFWEAPGAFYVRIIGLITLNAHILEALWFMSWKSAHEVQTARNVWLIILFGAFHLLPLKKKYYDN